MNYRGKSIATIKMKMRSAVQQAQKYARKGRHAEAMRCQHYADEASAELRRRGVVA